jgi:hypothetical protein
MGQMLRDLSAKREFGWVAFSEDEAFAGASGGTVLELQAATGALAPPKKGWRRWL